ncbi:MAG: hypothetical protein ORN51_08465 [Akkermansiaceae bacterium]|nr:hypothetical protein [Akkermansiaceae bacterium]
MRQPIDIDYVSMAIVGHHLQAVLQTSSPNAWISQRLEMGHNRSVSRLIRSDNDNPEIKRLCSKLPRMLRCEDCPRPSDPPASLLDSIISPC